MTARSVKWDERRKRGLQEREAVGRKSVNLNGGADQKRHRRLGADNRQALPVSLRWPCFLGEPASFCSKYLVRLGGWRPRPSPRPRANGFRGASQRGCFFCQHTLPYLLMPTTHLGQQGLKIYLGFIS